MTQFAIQKWMPFTLVSSTSSPEMHGNKPVPALHLRFEAKAVPNEFLDRIDPLIRQVLYTAHDKTEPIPGETKKTPDLALAGLIDMKLSSPKEYVGYILEIDKGLGEERGSNIKVGDCKVKKFDFELKKQVFDLGFSVHASGIDAETIGECGVLIKHEIKIKLRAPTLAEEQAANPFGRKGPETGKGGEAPPPDAGSIFAAQHGNDNAAPPPGAAPAKKAAAKKVARKTGKGQ
jgi:hypothetical protein